MRFGRLRLAVAVVGAAGVVAVWLVAENAGAAATAATQTGVVVATILLVAAIQHRANRRLALKIDNFRRRVYLLLGDEREVVDAEAAGTGIPQEHFEQLTRLLAANNLRLENAVDDLARQLGEVKQQTPAG